MTTVETYSWSLGEITVENVRTFGGCSRDGAVMEANQYCQEESEMLLFEQPPWHGALVNGTNSPLHELTRIQGRGVMWTSSCLRTLSVMLQQGCRWI